MGIDRGFVVTNADDAESVALFESFGAMRSPGGDILFGLTF